MCDENWSYEYSTSAQGTRNLIRETLVLCILMRIYTLRPHESIQMTL